MPPYLRDHPLTEARTADTENRAKQYPPRHVASSLDYYLTRVRLQVLTSKDNTNTINYFQDAINKHSCPNSAACEYGYALALLKAKKPVPAIGVLNKLIAADADQVIYQMALAEAKFLNKQQRDAISMLKHALNLYPDYYPLIVEYGEMLLRDNQANQARIFLAQQINDYPDDIPLYKLLAIAEGKSNHLADAYQTMAKLYEFKGQISMAIAELEQALQIPNLDNDSKAIINAKIIKLQTKLHGQKNINMI
jgi:beta-barrel assembly-enhancing protease